MGRPRASDDVQERTSPLPGVAAACLQERPSTSQALLGLQQFLARAKMLLSGELSYAALFGVAAVSTGRIQFSGLVLSARLTSCLLEKIPCVLRRGARLCSMHVSSSPAKPCTLQSPSRLGVRHEVQTEAAGLALCEWPHKACVEDTGEARWYQLRVS